MSSTGQKYERGARPGRTARRPGRGGAVGAFVWSLAFGLLSFYWAAGGTTGESTLSTSIRVLAEQRDPAFVATVWITGIGKILGGLSPLALAFGWWRRISRRLLEWSCILGGLLLTLYGIGDMVRSALILLDTGRSGADDEIRTAWWYLALWGPVWAAGGILFLVTGLVCRRIKVT